jgi:hypothetical protein
MIEIVEGISAGSPVVRITTKSPKRSIAASAVTCIGGSIGMSPSPRHSPISRSNCLIVELLSLLTCRW